MLKIIFGYGIDDETAIGHALDEYNSKEGRKTYHESKVRQIAADRFRCEIWYSVSEVQKQEEKQTFIGSVDIDPNDPNWYEKWKALQNASNNQAELEKLGIDQETLDAEWRTNTTDFTETMAHIADK